MFPLYMIVDRALLIKMMNRAVLAESFYRCHSRNYFQKKNSETNPNKIVSRVTVCIYFVEKIERCKYVYSHTHIP